MTTDFATFIDLTRENGWYEVDLTRYTDNHHAIDVQEWARNNCVGNYNSFGRHWVFEKSADAVLFQLRWA